VKKALVFYKGKAPKGSKTNWIMHEYRMAEINMAARKKNTLRLDDWVLCRIYNKKSSAERLEEKKLAEEMQSRHDMEETVEQQQKNTQSHLPSEPSPTDASTVSAEVGVPSTNSSLLNNNPHLPAPMNPFYQHQSTTDDSVQMNLKLANQLIQKQQSGQCLNFNLGLDNVQNPFFQLDNSEPSSLFNPYQEFIDNYSIQRSY